MTQINGKIYCAHGLEELILLKCPYYPKQYRDSRQTLSNINGIFHRSGINNRKIYMEPQKILNNQGNCEKEGQD